MKKPPIRIYIGIMVFFTTFTNYMLRVNINVSVIDMVDRKAKNFTPYCLREEEKENKSSSGKPAQKNKFEKFDWNENEVGLVLGAYFYGYLVTVVPGGYLSERIGPWHVILWSSLGGGILNALSHLSAKIGVWGIIILRFLIGLCGGVAYPAVNTLIANWAPPKEKGKFLAAMMGNTLGTVITYNVVGGVTEAYGYPWGFYVLSIIQGVFCFAFALITTDSPDKHRWISEAEQSYIREAQGGNVTKTKKVAPYKRILLSKPFWILVVAQFGNLWGLNLIISYAPKYMAETIGFKIQKSAGLAAAPNLARLVCSNIFGIIGDYMRKKEVMSLTKIRKFFIIFSHLIPALCLVMILFAKCNYLPVVILMILCQAFNGAVVVSHLINPQDLSPNYAGTIFGMMNFIGMTTGIFVPQITGAINEAYDMGLTAVTVITSLGGAVMAVSGVIFILFADAEIQPWNEIKAESQPQT